jgi:hypothetical protein
MKNYVYEKNGFIIFLRGHGYDYKCCCDGVNDHDFYHFYRLHYFHFHYYVYDGHDYDYDYDFFCESLEYKENKKNEYLYILKSEYIIFI